MSAGLAEYRFSLGDRSYTWVLTQTTWSTASAAATSAGGKLLTISSSAEASEIQTTLSDALDQHVSELFLGLQADTGRYIWLGANDTASENTWVWEDNSDVTYSNWSSASNYASRSLGADLDFAGLNVKAPVSSSNTTIGQWMDFSATDELTYIIEAASQAITIGSEVGSAARVLLANQSLVFVSSGADNTTVSMTAGTLATLSQEISFTHFEFSSQSYDHGIAISDVVLQLRDIVGLSSLSGTQKIAADIDGDGNIAISDVVSNLRHIVGLDTIEQCVLVDTSDQIVSNLTNSTIADLTLIQLGDVDLSATFVDIV